MKKDNLISETGESLCVLWNQRAQYGQIIVCSKHHFRRITSSKDQMTFILSKRTDTMIETFVLI